MSRAERRRQRLLIAQEKATSTADEVPFGAYQGEHVFEFLIYANTNGETVSFKWATSGGAVLEIVETITFTADTAEGSYAAPKLLTATAPTPAPPLMPPPLG